MEKAGGFKTKNKNDVWKQKTLFHPFLLIEKEPLIREEKEMAQKWIIQIEVWESGLKNGRLMKTKKGNGRRNTEMGEGCGWRESGKDKRLACGYRNKEMWKTDDSKIE